MSHNISLRNIKIDVLKTIVTISITHIIKKIRNPTIKLFDKNILSDIILTILGFLIYNIFSIKILNVIQSRKKYINEIIKSIIRFGTVFLVVEHLKYNLYNKDKTFKKQFQENESIDDIYVQTLNPALYTLLGFALYDGFMKEYIHKNFKGNSVDDIFRVSIGLTTKQLLEKSEFNNSFFTNIIIKLPGLIFFNEIILPKLKYI